jgi:exoribonuclease R
MAATYAHATAPLRRLADRYVVEAALAVANGRAVPEPVSAAFEKLPQIMARADALAGRIDRAVLDLGEAVLLSGREGETFSAVVTEVVEQWAKVQLCDLPVRARVAAGEAEPGEALRLRLTGADPARRLVTFEQA